MGTRIWDIGDGRSIRPFRDPWVPLQASYRLTPSSQMIPAEEGRVSDWIDSDNRTWRQELVRHAVGEVGAAMILDMQIPIEPRRDVLRWPHTRSGAVTVRSAYHCIHDKRTRRGQDLNQQPLNQSVWQVIWQSKVWQKIKAFMWKVASRVLPSRLNLVRGVQVTACYPFCEEVETTKHLLFGCMWAQQLWRRSQGTVQPVSSTISFEEWLNPCTNAQGGNMAQSSARCLLTMLTCWHVWKARCRFVFDNKSPHLENILQDIS